MNDTETAIYWSRNLIKTLNMGGVWGVPRSDVPKTAEELLTYQRMDFACIHGQFRMAGIEVKSEVKGVTVPC